MNELKTRIGFTCLAAFLVTGVTSWSQAQTNVPPTVSIVTPLGGAVSYTTNALIIDVQAGDVDRTVTQVGRTVA